jgi:hypothetical protein
MSMPYTLDYGEHIAALCDMMARRDGAQRRQQWANREAIGMMPFASGK